MRGPSSEADDDGEPEAVRDARAFGFDETAVADIRAALTSAEDIDGVWPENEVAVRAFLISSTQWRVVAGYASVFFAGLDYAGARAGIEAAGIDLTPEVWAGVRIMEAAAIPLLNGRPS